MVQPQPGCLVLLTRLRIARIGDNPAAFAHLVRQWRLTTAPLKPAARSKRCVQRLHFER